MTFFTGIYPAGKKEKQHFLFGLSDLFPFPFAPP
jgi:hypothetical protein